MSSPQSAEPGAAPITPTAAADFSDYPAEEHDEVRRPQCMIVIGAEQHGRWK
jgi:hypothetical protein